jgi:hypothetical protein
MRTDAANGNIFSAGAISRILILLTMVLLGSTAAKAASVTGAMTLGGAYTLDGGTDFTDASGLNLSNVVSTSPASGSLGTTVTSSGIFGTVNTSPLTYDPFTATANLLEIGGWQLDLGTLSIDSRTASALFLTGTGALSGNGFDLTQATWSLSAQATGGTYSMTVTAVAAPPVALLLGSGLIGLAGASRRKAAQV